MVFAALSPYSHVCETHPHDTLCPFLRCREMLACPVSVERLDTGAQR